MHSTIAVLSYLLLAGVFTFLVGFIACAVLNGARETGPGDFALTMAKRLDMIAGSLRDTPVPYEERQHFDRWANELERYAANCRDCGPWLAPASASTGEHVETLRGLLDQYPPPTWTLERAALTASIRLMSQAGEGRHLRAVPPADAVRTACEGRSPDCGPVAHWDDDGVALCDRCWNALEVDRG